MLRYVLLAIAAGLMIGLFGRILHDRLNPGGPASGIEMEEKQSWPF
jgi:hypothetical protein